MRLIDGDALEKAIYEWMPKDGYCAWAKKREDGDEPPKVRIGAFPQ